MGLEVVIDNKEGVFKCLEVNECLQAFHAWFARLAEHNVSVMSSYFIEQNTLLVC